MVPYLSKVGMLAYVKGENFKCTFLKLALTIRLDIIRSNKIIIQVFLLTTPHHSVKTVSISVELFLLTLHTRWLMM